MSLNILYVFLLYVLFVNNKIYIFACPDEHEALALLETLEEDQRTSSEFLDTSKISETSKCPSKDQNEFCDGSTRLSRLLSLAERLENGRKCLFDEEKWSDIVEKITKQTLATRITGEHDPDIYVIPDFLTLNQCQQLVELHDKISESATSNKWLFSTTQQLLGAVYRASLSPLQYNFSTSTEDCDGGMLEGDESVGRKLTQVLNYSSSVLVPRGESVMIDKIESYVEQTIGLPRTNAFHTQLLKYQTNSQYKNHTDCHAMENDRMATIIIYLGDVDKGGDTTFPFLNISIKPKRGMAVVWKNLDRHGQCDERTTHIATSVQKGTKYVFQKWFYESPILPQYQNSDFTFCDLSLSCRQYIYSKSTGMAVKYMTEGQKAANYVEAAKFYELALLQQPLHSGSLILHADALTHLGYYDRALPYLISVLKMHPRNKDAIKILKSVVKDFSNNITKNR